MKWITKRESVLLLLMTTMALDAFCDAAGDRGKSDALAVRVGQAIDAVAAAETGQRKERAEKAANDLVTYGQDRSELLAEVLKHAQGKDLSRENRSAYINLYEALGFTGKDKIGYVLPRLEQASPEEKKQLYSLLSTVPASDKEWLDYRFERSFLRSQKGNLYPQFIEHMFSVYPTESLPQLAEALIDDADTKRAVLENAKTLSDNVDQRLRATFPKDDAQKREEVSSALRSLADNKEWWVRYYVAKVLKKNVDLRTADLLALLKADDNSTVRSCVASLSTR